MPNTATTLTRLVRRTKSDGAQHVVSRRTRQSVVGGRRSVALMWCPNME